MNKYYLTNCIRFPHTPSTVLMR